MGSSAAPGARPRIPRRFPTAVRLNGALGTSEPVTVSDESLGCFTVRDHGEEPKRPGSPPVGWTLDGSVHSNGVTAFGLVQRPSRRSSHSLEAPHGSA